MLWTSTVETLWRGAFQTSWTHMNKIGCFELEEDVVHEENKKDKEGDKDNKGRDDTQNGGANYILASAFSPSGEFFVICDNRKQLHLFQTRPKWQLLSRR
ncbi:hypothetical protein ACJMK2_020272 [Sinanodonta woodiana]|uniref:Uncharacterized protein n=1 Tax=Sinanodonta woodiana TaxID=1069815 RepID=A0ABD3U132_SINWO